MELYILNRELELQGILDVFESLIWVRRYFKSGEFELKCSLTMVNLNLLKRDNIIYKKDDEEAGYIETRRLRQDNVGNEYLSVKGKFLTNYLDRRINWDRINFKGKTEELMRKIVLDNAINPTNINRAVPNLTLGILNGFEEDITYQNSFGNIITCLENIASSSNFGYKNKLDIENKRIIFDVYKGVNRTINNGDIAPCIFSRDFENILQQEYVDSINNYRNTVLIAGAGEGKDRKITFIENGNGLDRFELLVDARDIQDTKQVEKKDDEGNTIMEDVPIPLKDYNKLLIQRGNEKLEECKEIKSLDSKINLLGNNIYKKDFDLGDIVTLVDKRWNIKMDAQITEIEEVYEGGKIEISPIFGTSIPTLIDKIKQVMR